MIEKINTVEAPTMLEKLENLIEATTRLITLVHGVVEKQEGLKVAEVVVDVPQKPAKVAPKAKAKAKAKVEAVVEEAVVNPTLKVIAESKSLDEAKKIAQAFVKKHDLDAARAVVQSFGVDRIPDLGHEDRIKFMNVLLEKLGMELVA